MPYVYLSLHILMKALLMGKHKTFKEYQFSVRIQVANLCCGLFVATIYFSPQILMFYISKLGKLFFLWVPGSLNKSEPIFLFLTLDSPEGVQDS